MKKSRISYWASHLTTIVSVSLVLIIIGCIILISACASQESRNLRENVEMTVIMQDSVSDAQGQALYEQLKTRPWAKEMTFSTRADVLKVMNEETGDDIETIAGTNFLTPEISFTLKAEYCNEAQISEISKQLAALPEVDEVSQPDAQLLESMNTNIERLTLIFGIIAVVMIVISIVLINNTVRLTIYSRRFTIHTMQLVGATRWFITLPFIKNNLLAGLLAAVIADAVLAGAIVGSHNLEIPGLAISWVTYSIIAAILLVIGLLICSLAAAFATLKYLRKDYNQLFE